MLDLEIVVRGLEGSIFFLFIFHSFNLNILLPNVYLGGLSDINTVFPQFQHVKLFSHWCIPSTISWLYLQNALSGLKLGMVMYINHFSISIISRTDKGLTFFFRISPLFFLVKRDQLFFGLPPIYLERMTTMTLNLAWRPIVTNFKTNCIVVTLCWFCSLWVILYCRTLGNAIVLIIFSTQKEWPNTWHGWCLHQCQNVSGFYHFDWLFSETSRISRLRALS